MRQMMIVIGALCAMAAGTGAAQAGPASAGVASAMAGVSAAPAEVRWVCTYGRCVWRPHSRVRVPTYAQSWGPPPRPSCSFVRRAGPQGQSHWQQVCR